MVPYVGELCAAPKILIDSTWQLREKKNNNNKETTLYIFSFFFNVQLRK